MSAQATEKQVRMAAQLYDMRDKAKRLLGDEYRNHMHEIGLILRAVAAPDESVLSAAIGICKKRGLIGMDLMMVMAAAVEATEPSV